MDPSARFQAIQAKEAELQRREEALRKNNVEISEDKAPNFPPFCPFVRHDITADIPIRFAWTVRIAFILIIFTGATLIVNLIACCTTGKIIIGTGTKYSAGTNIVFGVIYLLLTVPLAFKVNYYKLYTLCREQNIKMTWFALQGIYIALNAYACAGMKNTGLIGIITMIDAMAAGANGATKAFCIISGVFWLLSTCGQVFLFGRVMAAYKGSGNAQPSPYSPVNE